MKRPMTKERERRVIKMPKPKPAYEIKAGGPIFVGYVSGFPCVLASKREIVARMLAERFMGESERDEIFRFRNVMTDKPPRRADDLSESAKISRRA